MKGMNIMFEKIKSVASNARNAINRKLVSAQSYVMAEAPNVLTSKAGNRFIGGCLAVSAAVVPAMAAGDDLIEGMKSAMTGCWHCCSSHWYRIIGVSVVPWWRQGYGKGEENHHLYGYWLWHSVLGYSYYQCNL